MRSLQVWAGRPPCGAWPSSTPGKAPKAARGPLGAVEHLVKAYNRGDLPPVEWLDPLTSAEIRRIQESDAAAVGDGGRVAPFLSQQHTTPLAGLGASGSVPWQHTAPGVKALQDGQGAAGLQLVIDLPLFPHAVLYQQAESYAADAAAQVGGIARLRV